MTVRDALGPVEAMKAVGRFAVPAGVLDVLRSKRSFERFGFPSWQAWRSAISPTARNHLEISRLGALPPLLLQSPKVVVDVGAQIGMWSAAVLFLTPVERLIAIEPTPSSLRQLHSRIGCFPGVKIVDCAVGSSPGTARFRIMSDSLFNSFLPVRGDIKDRYGHVVEHEAIEVEVRTLDEIAGEVDRVSILKIDVQGAEWDVFDGGRETLAKTSIVVLEANFISHYEGDACFDKLHARMSEEFGFELYRYMNPYHQGGQVLFADALYVRPDELKRHGS
jgi:FkbM family methyltransferase